MLEAQCVVREESSPLEERRFQGICIPRTSKPAPGYRQVRSSSVIRAFLYQRQMAINTAAITTARPA
jgi:hypothetical protein